MKKYVRKEVLLYIILFIMLFLVAIGIYIQDMDCIDSIRFVINTDNTSEKISLFKNNNIYYAFLPSYTNLNKINIEYENGCSVYIDNKLYSMGKNYSTLKTDIEYDLVVKNSFGYTVSKEKLVIMKSESIPALSVKLVDGTIEDVNRNKTVEKTGTCTLINANQKVEFNGLFDCIHGRGNYTWEQNKKPYNISFKDNVDLLEMGEAKNWILLSNPIDESYLRNKIVYDSAIDMGLKGSVESRYIDLYIDEVYYGLYMITEAIEIGENRVDIFDLEQKNKEVNNIKLNLFDKIDELSEDNTKYSYYNLTNDPEDISGGYIIENQFFENYSTLESCFTTKWNRCFSLKSPKRASKSEVLYIKNIFQNIEDSIFKGDYERYIDTHSWAMYYILQEFFGNQDERSFFLYKNISEIDDKVYAGPIWDLDQSLGNTFCNDIVNPEAFYVNTWGWYSELLQQDKFVNVVKDLYNEKFKDYFNIVLKKKIYEYQKEIKYSYQMNHARWNGIQKSDRCIHFDTLSEHVEYICDYLSRRSAFFEKAYGNNVSYCTVAFKSNYYPVKKYYYSIKKGSTITDIPDVELKGHEFIGWFNEKTDERFDPSLPITQNATYISKWEQCNDNIETVLENNIDRGLVTIINNYIKYNLDLVLTLLLFLLILVVVCVLICRDVLLKRRYKDEKRH